MVGICSLSLSLADSFGGVEAAASGIGRNLRSFNTRSGQGSGGEPRLYGGGRLRFFGERGIEDAIGQRSERGVEWRQDLLPGTAGVIEQIDFGLDLRAEFIGSAPELVEEARDLATDLRHFLGAEKDQRQEKNEDHLAREAEAHAVIIMRDG